MKILNSLQPSRMLLKVLVFAAIALAAVDGSRRSEAEERALKAVTFGVNKFSATLYREISSNSTDNVVFSPLGVQLVLALTYTGARGETARELAKVLSLPNKLSDTLIGYHTLISFIHVPGLKLFARIFVDSSASLKEEFDEDAEQYFHSMAESVNFHGDAEKSRVIINSFVANKTENQITDILKPGIVDNSTKMVLVNAVYYKSNWRNQFIKKLTKQEPFHVSSTKSVPVQMMHTKDVYGFVHDTKLNAKILRMDYEGGHYRMLVVLPDKVDGLVVLERKLKTINLFDRLKAMGIANVTVSFPRFKMEVSLGLKDSLNSLGIRTMFGGGSNFSGLSGDKLFVKDVVQKACIDVTDQGTEVSAATHVFTKSLTGWRDPLKNEVFVADHPFMFVIVHQRYRIPLFYGRYVAPT